MSAVLQKPAASTVKKSVEQVVKAWAETLTPKNAPDPKHCGPLAWARGEKVGELLQLLAKEGYR